ncbi:hypothetical protein [Streptomyces roseoverticillatus]|uniref:Secreted protein n=1 Tax=Streptomyces roseoverticillatus TaxID=66429 RepID=A0ABV3IU66_9ACTN
MKERDAMRKRRTARSRLARLLRGTACGIAALSAVVCGPAVPTAAAATGGGTVRYYTRGYDVTGYVTAESVGDNGYRISVRLVGECDRPATGATTREMAVRWGGGRESWKRSKTDCNAPDATYNTANYTGTGRLDGTRILHVEVGAFGGGFSPFGSWGWSPRLRIPL